MYVCIINICILYIYIYIYVYYVYIYIELRTKFETLVWRLMKGLARN